MSLGALFIGFARMGTFTFGGGPSMIPLMQQECVKGGFVTEDGFLEGLAIGNALPGPIATKLAVWVGWHHAGVAGAAVALSGLLLPSTVMIAIVGALLARYRHHPVVAGALLGLKPAMVGMLFFTAVELAPAGVKGSAGILLALAAFVALYARVHPALVVVAAMVVGGLWLRSGA